MACVIIGLGSNLGNRRLNIARAVSGIAEAFGNFEVSHIIESQPWGYDSMNPYLNGCMTVVTDEEPLRILEILKGVEKSISPESHRDSEGHYADRHIDIDILAIDGMTIDTPELKVPHPMMARRSFVLEPMCELVPAWKHPATGKTPAEMLADLDANTEEA